MLSPAHYQSYKNQSIALIGYGVTGKACTEFLLGKGASVSVFDKSFDSYSASSKHLNFYPLDDSVSLTRFDTVVVSPGVNLQQAFIKNFQASGQHNSKQVIGDIELFARELEIQNKQKAAFQKATKVIAITGSNGKSTVVDMLAKAFTKSGLRVALGGNFGTSALSLLSQDYDLIVLELSSFQLESTYSLKPDVACILNISADHLDRHGNIQNYTAIKHRIFQNADQIIYNRDDDLTKPIGLLPSYSFGLNMPEDSISGHHFYQTAAGIYCNNDLVLDIDKLKSSSQFQLLNMQVVLACAHILNAKLLPVVDTLIAYVGLHHRFEVIHKKANVVWINDSKATNPGACLAALESASLQYQHIILIAGGDAKGADASILANVIEQHVDMMLLIGKDAALFTQFNIPFQYASSMDEAVGKANEYIQSLPIQDSESTVSLKPSIAVLLSPACASIDMFKNYQERGDLFCQAVHDQVAA